jgi:hypothetical protein
LPLIGKGPVCIWHELARSAAAASDQPSPRRGEQRRQRTGARRAHRTRQAQGAASSVDSGPARGERLGEVRHSPRSVAPRVVDRSREISDRDLGKYLHPFSVDRLGWLADRHRVAAPLD